MISLNTIDEDDEVTKRPSMMTDVLTYKKSNTYTSGSSKGKSRTIDVNDIDDESESSESHDGVFSDVEESES